MVEVLLATYNGERYLREQLDSILGQDFPDLSILARDDGSTDRTVEILDEYARQYPDRIRVCRDGSATGHPKRNFLRLMKASTADYVCFADQDDVWLPGKVSLALQAMKRLEGQWDRGTPLLVFTDLCVVNEKLETIHPSFWKRSGLRVENIRRLSRVLDENSVTGCTALINRSMCDLAVQMPEEADMHDWWIALLAATFGAAEAVPQSTVLYRQHDNNVVGSVKSDTSLGGLAFRAISGENRHRARLKCERQAEALLRQHGKQMKVGDREMLDAYLISRRSDSAWKRIGTTVRYGFYRSGVLKNLATIIDLIRPQLIVPEKSPVGQSASNRQ